MAPPRHVIVAGAGIAGLTAALTMARAGLRVTVLEQAEKLEETGAGIQLSPNATRVLDAIGLRERLQQFATAPQAIRVMAGRSAREIVRIPLGAARRARATARPSSPSTAPICRRRWRTPRAPSATSRSSSASGRAISPPTTTASPCRAAAAGEVVDERGIALIGADGVWSSLAQAHHAPAAAALCPSHRLARAHAGCRPAGRCTASRSVHLWLGQDAHLVHYPVKARHARSTSSPSCTRNGTSPAGRRRATATLLLRHFARWTWADEVRDLLAIPKQWLKWALYEGRGPLRDGSGPVTLIGDAAHPMLPFLAQGAGMAIEDAAVLAAMLGKYLDDPGRRAARL